MSGMTSGETPYLSPRRGGGSGALEYSQVFVRIEAPEPDRVRILIRQACIGGPVEKRPAVAFEVSIDPDVGTLRLEEHPVRYQDREEGTTPWRGAGDREDATVSAAARQGIADDCNQQAAGVGLAGIAQEQNR
jgi:hypothetical protein